MSQTTLSQIKDYLSGSFCGIWLLSQDPQDAVSMLYEFCCRQAWPCVEWDAANGAHELELKTLVGSATEQHLAELAEKSQEKKQAAKSAHAGQAPPGGVHTPRSAIGWTEANVLRNLPANFDRQVMIIMHYPQRFWDNPCIVQTIHTVIQAAQSGDSPLVIVAISGSLQLPEELDKDFVIIEHALPDRKELIEIAERVENVVMPTKKKLEAVLDASIGLCRREAESAFAYSAAKYARELIPTALWEYKAQALKKSAALSLYKGEETLNGLGGLDHLKQFALSLLNSKNRSDDSELRPLGLLLLGPPGTGKSAFCKALGNAVGRPTVQVDMASVYGGIVGETEKNIKRALQVLDAQAPCIGFFDEIEKALSGTESRGRSDGGIGDRVFGTFLTWLSDHKSDVFIVATSNDITKLPPAFQRAERFDAIFFMDLPGLKQRETIWQMYMQRFGLVEDGEYPVAPPSKDWTGAEIRACCRLAKMRGISLEQSARNIVPVAHTAAEEIQALRNWSQGRALSAEVDEVYQMPVPAKKRLTSVCQ